MVKVKIENIKNIVLIGEVYEKRGRNPFLDKETWRVSALCTDNINRIWYKLIHVQDERDILMICENEMIENFVKVDSILL